MFDAISMLQFSLARADTEFSLGYWEELWIKYCNKWILSSSHFQIMLSSNNTTRYSFDKQALVTEPNERFGYSETQIYPT